jgi:hypothetical protein
MTTIDTTSALPADAAQALERLLHQRLASAGLKRVEAEAGQDFEGDEALYLDLYFDLVEPELDPEPFNFLTTELRETLESFGEHRFPHLRYHFDARQKVAGWR